MEQIIVTTQAELDAVATDFDGRVIIKFGTPYNRAMVNRRFKYSVVAWDNSSVVAWDNSSVVARGNSSVEARGNSSVVARENSSVEARENSSVEARGNVQILDKTSTHNLSITGNARIVYDPRNISEYIDYYGIESDGKTAKLFKAVHKRDGGYFSDYGNLEYRIGEIAVADSLDTNPREDCGHGIHMAHKAWCLDYGRDWDDLAILEVEAEMPGIIVPEGNRGKVRAAQVKVLREVPLSECGLMGKLMEKRRTATP
jgi:hypothetical protein